MLRQLDAAKAAHDHRRLYINGLARPHVNQTHLSKQVVGWIWLVGHSLSSPNPDLITGKILNTKKPHLHEAVQCKVVTLMTPLCNRKGPVHHSRGTPRTAALSGSLLRLYGLSPPNSQHPYGAVIVRGPTLCVGKLRHRAVKEVGQAHVPVGGHAGNRSPVIRPEPFS